MKRTARIVGVVDKMRVWCAGCRDVAAFDDGFVWTDSHPLVRHARCAECGRVLDPTA